jgi:hypothetical protein
MFTCGLVKPLTMKLVFSASLLSTQQLGVSLRNDWFDVQCVE